MERIRELNAECGAVQDVAGKAQDVAGESQGTTKDADSDAGEASGIPEEYRDFVRVTTAFLLKVDNAYQKVQQGMLPSMSLEELRLLNRELFCDVLPESYEKSYANPTYAVRKFGETMGQYLSFVYTELRGNIAFAFEQRIFDMTIAMELYLEVVGSLSFEEKETAIKEAIYYYISDYSRVRMEKRFLEQIDPNESFVTDIIMNEDLLEERYLYYLGEYISENERKLVAYMKDLPEETIFALAKTYTDGYRIGFDTNNVSFEGKKTVNIRYSVGFERIVKAAILQFRKMGLEPTIYRAAVNSSAKKQHLKIGFYSSSPNKQFDYDHRMDNALYMNKALNDRKLEAARSVYEEYKELAKGYAGPAVIEIFGETPFAPISKPEAVTLSAKQQKLSVEFAKQSSLLLNEYIPGDAISFTIIAYPVPEIGDNFAEIFDETVKVNTLDMEKYKKIQQCLIDALDQGEYVRITGRGANRTDIRIALRELKNPSKETLFENCLADVNIPLGEVFTSPKLTGTKGVLHVTEVYLNDLKYKNLELTFEDGKIADYTCSNFEKEEENKAFIKENLMYQHDTLPIGEFAIGTNTTAYVMGQKYDIAHKLPILIAEKTGPHFAVGDTCYKMAEEIKTYNPDGKEIVAKENECSALRKTEIDKAYFNCHTDITIPYNELGDIVVYGKGKEITLLKEGRFVLEGTTDLNLALEEYEQQSK
ncbi:MAG: aminopeptidase [Lachnospiraceae bacterium]|nr:aminopeptidase [Lachnospiraceae bacterium]